jgi:thiol-disulfide isomerase/thioredoxin
MKNTLTGMLWAWIAAIMMTGAACAAETLPFVKGSYAAIRQAHAGRPLIIHIWGLSCGPCLVELPEWGKLATERPGVALVLVNADRADIQSAKRIIDVLSKSGLSNAESYAFADRYEDRLRFEIDKTWQGELPRSVLISATGVATTLEGVADMATVRAWLDRTVR